MTSARLVLLTISVTQNIWEECITRRMLRESFSSEVRIRRKWHGKEICSYPILDLPA